MKAITFVTYAILTTGLCSVAGAQDVGQISDREITPLRDDLYQVRNGQQTTVFLVTPEGIILADPLRRDTALWLKGELDARFPQRPVRFILLSHHHVERAEGASVFSETAQVVGNRAFDSELIASRRVMPDAYRFVQQVDTTFDSRRTITLGGRSVELVSTEGLHTADMTVMYFPAERVAFVVDPPQITTVPFSFGPDRPRESSTGSIPCHRWSSILCSPEPATRLRAASSYSFATTSIPSETVLPPATRPVIPQHSSKRARSWTRTPVVPLRGARHSCRGGISHPTADSSRSVRGFHCPI